jgi:glyceraldehyde-3-phosphate dehydrogenase/erythrose-4-phosphate dehydrogenase
MAKKTYRIEIVCEQTGESLLKREKLTEDQAKKVIQLAPHLDALTRPASEGAGFFGLEGKR